MSQNLRSVLALWALVASCACGSATGGGGGAAVTCAPGALLACPCAGGQFGVQACTAAGLGFGPCGGCKSANDGDSLSNSGDSSSNSGDSGATSDSASAADVADSQVKSDTSDATPEPDVPVVSEDSADTTEVDVAIPTAWTIAKIQAQSTSSDCAKIVSTLAGVTLSEVVVVSPLRFSTSKAGKESEGLFVQTQGGGPSSGLYLTEDKGSQADITNATPGSVLSLIGDVAEFFCSTWFKPKSVVASAGVVLPVATQVEVDTIGEKAATATNKLYESVYVSIDNVVVSDPLALGSDGKPHTIMVGKTEDDLTLRIGAGFGVFPLSKDGKANYSKGQHLDVTGVLEFTFNVWQLTPLSIAPTEN